MSKVLSDAELATIIGNTWEQMMAHYGITKVDEQEKANWMVVFSWGMIAAERILDASNSQTKSDSAEKTNSQTQDIKSTWDWGFHGPNCECPQCSHPRGE